MHYILSLNSIPTTIWCTIGLAGVGAGIATKKLKVGLLTTYLFLILTKTVLLRRPYTGCHFQPELFWSWRVWGRQQTQILANVILYIPVGVMFSFLIRGKMVGLKAVLVGAGFSFLVETLQLILQRGLFEFDDVIHNSIGCLIGVLLVVVWQRITSQAERERVKHPAYAERV